MTVYRAPLQMAKTSLQSLLDTDQREEVLKENKARVRSQVLRFEPNIQSGPDFTSNLCFAMFHVSGLHLDWYGVLVNVHCTNPETTFLHCLHPRLTPGAVRFPKRRGYFPMWLNLGRLNHH
jgi:hypothetical protein